jgi:predicted ATPase/DNA-binding SARP family transcriptional activator
MVYKEPVNPSLKIYLLGTFRIAIDGSTVDAKHWTRRKSKLLIKLLALQPQHQLHREQVIDFLWPEQTLENATNNLHKSIHAARRSLEPQLASGSNSRYILTREQQIILSDPSGLWIDVESFHQYAAEAIKHSNIEAYEAALMLYRGDLLAEDLYEDWATAQRDRLRTTYHRILLGFAKVCKENGHAERSINLMEKLIACDELNEEAYRQLMILYALQGERHESLRLYEQCQSVLREQLSTVPETATARIYEQIVSGTFALSSSVSSTKIHVNEIPLKPLEPTVPINLPQQVTSFVGREQEIAQVKQLLTTIRLVTLTGTGGIGKTRLAQQVAREVLEQYSDGVRVVELAALTDQTLVPFAVASALGVREEPGRTLITTLSDYLRTKRMLLMLDNCEHVIEASVALIDHLLRVSTGIHILVTSRESLGSSGEAVWKVGTLSLPKIDQEIQVRSLAECESVRLFLDRVTLSNPRWRLTEQNAPAVAKLCCRLDGIPLAIELAASRMKVLAVEQIISKFDAHIDVLIGDERTTVARHHTLRAAINWSHDLLPLVEKKLLRRLSIFAGGWTLDAVEAICVSDDMQENRLLGLLSRLVDKSLVLVEHGGVEARYYLLETIRYYGQERLCESDEELSLGERHYKWFLHLAESADSAFSGAEQRIWFERLEVEHDNLRAALHWAIVKLRDAEKGLRLSGALWRFWQAHGHLSEGRKWLEAALSLESKSTASTRAKAWHGAGGLASAQGDFEHAQVFLEESLVLRREMKDTQGVAHALQRLGIIAYYFGEYDRAAMLQEESLLFCQTNGDETGIARAFNGLGILALDQGIYNRAERMFERCLSIYRKVGHQLGVMASLNNLGETAERQAEYVRAEKLLQESLAIARQRGDKGWIARSMHLLGTVANSQGEYEMALNWFKKASTIFQEIGDASIVYVLEGFACTAAAQGDVKRAFCLAKTASAYRKAMKMKRTPADQSLLNRYFNEPAMHTNLKQEQALASVCPMTVEQAVAYATHSR